MIDLVLVAIVAVVGGGTSAVGYALVRMARFQREQDDARHHETAAALGLVFERRRGAATFEGVREGVRVRVELTSNVTPGEVMLVAEHTHYEVGSPARITIRKGVRPGDQETGDAAFDGNFLVDGSEAIVLGALDPETRLMLWNELAAGVKLENGVLSHDRPAFDAPYTIDQRLRQLAGVAARLRLPDDELAARLVRRFASETAIDIRARCLEALARTFPDLSGTREALDAGLGSHEPQLVLVAAVARGDVARLRELLRGGAYVPTRASAAKALAERHALEPPDEPALRALLSSEEGRTEPVIAALEAIGSRDSVEALLSVRGALRKRATEAVERIQSKLTGERGALAIPDGSGGELAISPGKK